MSSISKPAPPRTRPSTRSIKPSPFVNTQINQTEQHEQFVHEKNEDKNVVQLNVSQDENAQPLETNHTTAHFSQHNQYLDYPQYNGYSVEPTIKEQPNVHEQFHSQQEYQVEVEEEEQEDEGLNLELKRLEEEHRRKMYEHEQEKKKLAQASIEQHRTIFLDDVDSFFAQFGDNKQGNSSNSTVVDDLNSMGSLFATEIEKAKMTHTQKINQEKQRLEEERRIREEQQERQEALESERRIQLAKLEIEEQKRKEEEEARKKMEEEKLKRLEEERLRQQMEEERRRRQMDEERRRQQIETTVKPSFQDANEKLFAASQTVGTTQVVSQAQTITSKFNTPSVQNTNNQLDHEDDIFLFVPQKTMNLISMLQFKRPSNNGMKKINKNLRLIQLEEMLMKSKKLIVFLMGMPRPRHTSKGKKNGE